MPQKTPDAKPGKEEKMRTLKISTMFGVVAAILTSCSEKSETCFVGTEGCSCTPGGSCGPGLDCASDLCVDLSLFNGEEGESEIKEGKTESEAESEGECPDEGLSCGSTAEGLCRLGIIVCDDGKEVCTGAIGPEEETCDGEDNDCDGVTDENWSELGYPCDGDDGDLCLEGTWICNASGTGVRCTDMTDTAIEIEVCDGEDNDCDGVTDEGIAFQIIPYSGPEGTEGIGICRPEIWGCSGGDFVTVQEEVLPQPETFNGLDNDCDGVASCEGGIWRNEDSGELTHAGLGLREPGVMEVYGDRYGYRLEGGAIPLPRCPYFSGEVRLPVFMVDWEDFDPVVDLSNETNPESDFPDYIPSTPAELYDYLHGPSGVAQYFQDVSGGLVNLSFDIFGWIRSDTADSYLQPRSDYIYSDPTWQCRREDVFLDAMRDAIVFHDADMTDYDADRNGVLDGAVLVYEGTGGICSGANLSSVGLTFSFDSTPPSFSFPAVPELVDELDSNWPDFAEQEVWLHVYNNIPERYPDNSFYRAATWTHELGHLLLGYPDYYYNWFGFWDWGLSSSNGPVPNHPAAFEKWLFARWIEPETIITSGEYLLEANEIPDGTAYDGGPYLYVISIGGDPNRFLTVESRWFDNEGNDTTQWAAAYYRESGLMIIEFNLGVDWLSSDPPQLLRHHPPTREGQSELAAVRNAYRPGDVFAECYDTTCVTITPLESAGPEIRIAVDITAP